MRNVLTQVTLGIKPEMLFGDGIAPLDLIVIIEHGAPAHASA